MCNISTILGQAGWVGRVPPGIKEFLNLPVLVLKARHPAPQFTVSSSASLVAISIKKGGGEIVTRLHGIVVGPKETVNTQC